MQSAEIEVKFPVPDSQQLQSRLPQLGFTLETPRTFEHNTLYDTPGRDLRQRRQILRLRRYGDLCVLTHKRMPENADDSQYKTRIETESLVSDCSALAEIFRQLGYTPAFVYEKFRTEWAQPLPGKDLRAHLVVDETPIGIFAELEGPPDWIERILAQLQIDRSTCMTDSYGTLFLKWKQSSGSPANNLTFEEIAPSLATR
jgi:adenylate cyclase class 2